MNSSPPVRAGTSEVRDTDITMPGGCSRGAPIGSPDTAFHRRAVPSLHPVSTVLLSGLYARAQTCPHAWRTGYCSGAANGSPVSTSHNRAVLSWPLVRTDLPSGLKIARIS